MMSSEQVRAVAQAFADALDRNEFERVAALLAPACRYDLTSASFTSEGSLVGPTAIVDSYRWHDARARRLFDKVTYTSVVETVDGMTAVIRFNDELEQAGHRHTYRCRQRITVDKTWAIDTIVQEDIPEEKVAVRAFMDRFGIAL